MPTINTSDFLGTADVAKKLGVDVDTVRRYCANYLEGRTPAIKGLLVGRSWLIHRDVVKDFMANRRDRGRPKAG